MPWGHFKEKLVYFFDKLDHLLKKILSYQIWFVNLKTLWAKWDVLFICSLASKIEQLQSSFKHWFSLAAVGCNCLCRCKSQFCMHCIHKEPDFFFFFFGRFNHFSYFLWLLQFWNTSNLTIMHQRRRYLLRCDDATEETSKQGWLSTWMGRKWNYGIITWSFVCWTLVALVGELPELCPN